MNILTRATRHARISWRARNVDNPPSPPFLILFITSICNLTCEHCFYWRNLNQRDDLTVDEILNLAREMGPIENLNLGGGEPFIRKEYAEICRFFIRNNQVKQIYCPTSGYFTDRTVRALTDILANEPSLKFFTIELSLDGTQDFHNKFRGNPQSFQKAMQTYDELAEIQKRDPRLRIHSISTVTSTNTDEIRQLTEYLYRRCPAMDHHNLALIRGDRKNPSLKGPELEAYRSLYDYIRRLWAPREKGRYGAIVEPLLQWTKTRTATEERQVVPCRAGVLSAVVYANGDVATCESLPPLGNLRKQSFREIWKSQHARQVRCSIRNRECYCTNEVFMWPSIVFQPFQLAKAMIGSRVWRKPKPLTPQEKEHLVTLQV